MSKMLGIKKNFKKYLSKVVSNLLRIICPQPKKYISKNKVILQDLKVYKK